MAILPTRLNTLKLLRNLEKQRNLLLPDYIIFYGLINYFKYLIFSIAIHTVS